ncbi:hypothetical protein Q5P01_018790 [Channa striata]|uniref:Uncharacterized protein n=1 Tax=Channa striata TaxID=64152 RepID=A0AA88SGB7_CHASR|nr:hypothetical protein Q5P01_018790 [Channa striata]
MFRLSRHTSAPHGGSLLDQLGARVSESSGLMDNTMRDLVHVMPPSVCPAQRQRTWTGTLVITFSSQQSTRNRSFGRFPGPGSDAKINGSFPSRWPFEGMFCCSKKRIPPPPGHLRNPSSGWHLCFLLRPHTCLPPIG